MTRFSSFLLCIITVLLVVNISLTLVLLGRSSGENGGAERASSTFDPTLARAWGDKVVVFYNRQDHEALYGLFNEQARVKVSGDQLESQLEKLHQLFGDIEDHAYVNSVQLAEKGPAEYHQLLFNLRVSENPNPATMTISVVLEGDAISLYGLRVNGTAGLD